MTYVIAAPCAGCKDKSCLTVCPVDCIHEGRFEENGHVHDQLFIDPELCIDCGCCEPECPVDAIFMADELPEQWRHYIQIHADFFRRKDA